MPPKAGSSHPGGRGSGHRQADRDWGFFRAPHQMWAESPPPQELPWWGMAESSVRTRVPSCPKQGHVTIRSISWEGFLNGTGRARDRNEPNQTRSQFPFIKRLVVGKDSENLNHNCKQMEGGGSEAPLHHPPLLSWLRAPRSQHSMREEKRGVRHLHGSTGSRGPWETRLAPPAQDSEQPHPGLSEVSMWSPDCSHARANEEHVRRGQTSVPGV